MPNRSRVDGLSCFVHIIIERPSKIISCNNATTMVIAGSITEWPSYMCFCSLFYVLCVSLLNLRNEEPVARRLSYTISFCICIDLATALSFLECISKRWPCVCASELVNSLSIQIFNSNL